MRETVIGAVLQARVALWNEFTWLHRAMLKIARADPVYWQLTIAPGIRDLVAVTYRWAIDDRAQFAKSRTVGVYFDPVKPTSTAAAHGVHKRTFGLLRHAHQDVLRTQEIEKFHA